MYNIKEVDNLKYLTFPSLEKQNDLFHCFTTRYGGVSEGCFSSMNLALVTNDDMKNVYKNYEILCEKLSLNQHDMVRTYQTHTANIRYATDEDKGKFFDEIPGYIDVDGLITDKKNIALTTCHGDCTPIYFYDPIKKIIGMAHAGWKGTVQNIAGNMVKKFKNDFNSNSKDIITVIGPSLCQSCFEVDEDVKDVFIDTDINFKNYMIAKGKKYHFDLWEINKYLMMQEGILAENIEISRLCTKCNNDMFFSHRGQKGMRGLMIGIIMIK